MTKLLTTATSVGLEIRTSTDRTAWSLVGKVWPNGASWTDKYTGTSNGWVWTISTTYAVSGPVHFLATFGHQIAPISTGNSG